MEPKEYPKLLLVRAELGCRVEGYPQPMVTWTQAIGGRQVGLTLTLTVVFCKGKGSEGIESTRKM